MVVFAGVVANASVDSFGLVSPFMVAIVFLVIALFFIQANWTENYGTQASVSLPPSWFVLNDVLCRLLR
jgi:Sugar-tranasporters, 12 TM